MVVFNRKKREVGIDVRVCKQQVTGSRPVRSIQELAPPSIHPRAVFLSWMADAKPQGHVVIAGDRVVQRPSFRQSPPSRLIEEDASQGRAVGAAVNAKSNGGDTPLDNAII